MYCFFKFFINILIFLIININNVKSELKVCNRTNHVIGVSIGYKNKKNKLITEGWWNISNNICQIIFPKLLKFRYYYIYAIDYEKIGEWGGLFFMCTKEKKFTIEGINNCLVRGYEKTGFAEIDTKKNLNWTIQLINSNNIR